MQGSGAGDPFDLITQQNIHQQLDELLQEEIYPVSHKFSQPKDTPQAPREYLKHGQQLHQIVQQHINDGNTLQVIGKTSHNANPFEQCQDDDFDEDDGGEGEGQERPSNLGGKKKRKRNKKKKKKQQ